MHRFEPLGKNHATDRYIVMVDVSMADDMVKIARTLEEPGEAQELHFGYLRNLLGVLSGLNKQQLIDLAEYARTMDKDGDHAVEIEENIGHG